MLALAALLSIGSASPEAPLLDSFKAACQNIDNFEAARSEAAKAGWEAAPEDAEPRIANLLKLGREAIGDSGKISGGTYRQSFDGTTVWLVLSRFEDKSGFWGNGCRAYDFAATAPFDAKALETWLGKAPTGNGEQDGMTRQSWEPGWRDGVSIEATYIPAGHPGIGNTGLQGRVLVAEAIGGF
ncbi:hypothetical protein [Sphingomonas sp. G-3-2-10]|uniref:hypothetical protein n=1 Tax=Sphingomonas sp. G-3-2-10 TaxID=2728838 RepID=UPI001469FDA0|nr:hypothetical protein [Sphingomonas sp. G-3-2-10]NML06919.1 hypothetical protein [Sphingomonas sp. G-3-2-10]